MRTKTLLLAAAALAAGITYSEAQSNVYSQNIVGYVNVICPAGQFVLLANPLDNGTNDLISLDSGLPNRSTAEIWNGSGFTLSSKVGGVWSADLSIPPGTGFFVEANTTFTNTFVGQVGVGGVLTNTVALPTGFSLVGSIIPYSGTITDSGPNTINIGPSLPNRSTIETWNGSGFTLSSLVGGTWSSALTITPGQGFFVEPNSATTWSQSLTNSD